MRTHQYLESWKKQGYKVRIRHERKVDPVFNGVVSISGTYTKKEIATFGFDSSIIQAKGGRTVLILEKDGQELRAEAACSKKDGYNKKLGLRIAVNRMLNTIKGN